MLIIPTRTKAALLRSTNSTAARAQDAYHHLMSELLEGPLSPGDWLSVVELSSTLNCSRVPVMEALKRLASEGFVTIVPQVGCQVAIPAPDEVLDFFTLFAAVEGCVVRFAAERRTDEQLVAFKKTCTEIDRRLKTAGGPTDHDPIYRRLNLMFHREIHDMAHAPNACQIAAGLWDRSDFYIKIAFGSLYFNKRVRQAHLTMRRAIHDGNAKLAEKAITEHLQAVGATVVTALKTAS